MNRGLGLMPRPLILHYHGLAEMSRRLDPFELMLPPGRFRSQIALLQERGYRFVHQREFARRLVYGESLDGFCSITFDDGTQDNASELPPLLDELAVPVTIYVCPGLLGRPYPFTAAEAGVRMLDRNELEALAADPLVEIGSHTREHTALAGASAEEALAEMSGSRSALERMIGVTVTSFAYPDCEYSPACPDAARRAGYTSAVTCGPRGTLAQPYELARVSISPKDDRLRFELKLRGRFEQVWELPPVRLARAVSRRMRSR